MYSNRFLYYNFFEQMILLTNNNECSRENHSVLNDSFGKSTMHRHGMTLPKYNL